MTNYEMQAEAMFQVQLGRNSGIKKVIPFDNDEYIEFENGTRTTNNGRHVEFELNGKICVVDIEI